MKIEQLRIQSSSKSQFRGTNPRNLTSIALGIWCFVIPSSSLANEALALSWTNNHLSISSPKVPGGKLDVLYLEAFCHKGSTQRDWGKTVLRYRTTLLSSAPEHLRFRTRVAPEVEVLHEIRSAGDEVDFHFSLTNQGTNAVDLEWFQPACIRVADFTGRDQSNYVSRCFIFTDRGLTMLDQTRRQADGFYRGGQVYMPRGVDLADVNPRPLCLDQPVNGLIGCFSADGKYLLATASDRTQELFEGVFVCLHSDPRVGGLAAGEMKNIHAKLYLIENHPDELLRRYRKDFPKN